MEDLAGARSKLVRRATVQVKGSHADSVHSYDPRETDRYTTRINKIMRGDPSHAPLGTDSLFSACGDGKWLCNFLNRCEPGSIDTSAIARVSGGGGGKKLAAGLQVGAQKFANDELMGLFLEGCKKAGLQFGNVGSADFTRSTHKEHLVLGVIWQLLKRQLGNEIKDMLRADAEAKVAAALAAAEAAGRAIDEEAARKQAAAAAAAQAKAAKDPEVFLVDWVNTTLSTMIAEAPTGPTPAQAAEAEEKLAEATAAMIEDHAAAMVAAEEAGEEAPPPLEEALQELRETLAEEAAQIVSASVASQMAAISSVASVGDLSTEKSDALVRLAHAMAPSAITEAALATDDPSERATKLVEWASEQGIPVLAEAEDLRDSNPRLILPFVMSMFAFHHAQEDIKVKEVVAAAAATATGEEGVVAVATKHAVAAAVLKAVFVVRQHWHVPVSTDGSSAGSCSSNTICAFRAEADALRYVLGENITVVGTDPELPHLLTLSAAYAAQVSCTAAFTPSSRLTPPSHRRRASRTSRLCSL
jgi:hypothetical protein